MKNKEAQYANVILAMIEKGISPEKAVADTMQVVRDRKHLALLPRIKKALAREALRRKRKSETILVVADAADAAQAKIDAVRALGGSAHDTLSLRVDDSIIGGWVIQSHDTRVDASYKRSLRDIYLRVIQ